MNEFLPPTKAHLLVFTAFMVIGTIAVICDLWPVFKECDPSSLSQVLENLTFVLLLSTGWSVIVVEVKEMFVEGWLKQRKKEGKQEGKQETINELILIAKQRALTEQDLRDFRDGKLGPPKRQETATR